MYHRLGKDGGKNSEIRLTMMGRAGRPIVIDIEKEQAIDLESKK